MYLREAVLSDLMESHLVNRLEAFSGFIKLSPLLGRLAKYEIDS